ncbi:MAG: hypothetical protein ACREPT_11470 [Rudaea sp.]
MKSIAIVIALLCFTILAGCAQVQATIDKQVQADPLIASDLKTALADATAAGNTSGITCWGGLQTYIGALPTNANGAAPTVGGVATAIELGSELRQHPQSIVALPPLPRPVHDACAGLIQDDIALLAKFGVTVGGISNGTIGALKAGLITP